MDFSRYLSMDELNKTALEQFVYQPVGRDMIAYLAEAANNVISCDTSLMPPAPVDARNMPPSPPRSPEPRTVRSEDGGLPTLEEFITQLVVSSNVQVPTLMSTLVYLTRLKSKLQPMARGLRCTTHRIFLAALILAAKYLNDSSPKNKHWANYSHINTDVYNFGFSRTEVNLMEKQLLFLLDWDLRITEEDLYRELDDFLEPLRHKVAERHAKKMRHREEKLRQQHLYAASTRYPSPPASRGHSRSRQMTPEHARTYSHTRTISGQSGPITPPGLTYSSSASSYASSTSSRAYSRATTPLDSEQEASYLYETQQCSLYDSPVQIMADVDCPKRTPASRMLPYEISADEYQQYQLHESQSKKQRPSKRGMWERLLGGSVAAR
ncbi:PHO85 cyclin-1 [Neonectria punicea]|uniref:PHO85 cyclin-1 n=1 Tax=Neonectria punicea TaxID=979145 RepID=A0ABR1H066_9HYPO